MTRLAIVDKNKCKPKKCKQECRRYCPPQQTGKQVIDIEDIGKARISESLCIGCGACVKRCPFNAITIVNLPTFLTKENPMYRYGPNEFALFRLPTPEKGSILGLLGQNGIGKSTVVGLLSNKYIPQIKITTPELKNYLSMSHSIAYKPQSFDTTDVVVSTLINSMDISDVKKWGLDVLVGRNFEQLSGGEKQRVMIASTLFKPKTDCVILDEPTTYLDIKQRMMMVPEIRKQTESKYVVIIDHDIAILDYLSDKISVLYGSPSMYGVVTKSMKTADGVNAYLDGFLPHENIRIRPWSLNWNNHTDQDTSEQTQLLFNYPSHSIRYSSFKLDIDPCTFYKSEIVVVLGENGIGKSTWMNWIKETYKSLLIAYKPQLFDMNNKEKVVYYLGYVTSELLSDLFLNDLLELSMDQLSGGQRQRVEIAKCLSQPADLYLFDEPSAGLDIESRFAVARLLRRWVINNHCSAIVIEHDLYLSNYISDKIITVLGYPGVYGHVSSSDSNNKQLNIFLESIGITIRRDHNTKRPRINSYGSTKDREQRYNGTWYIE